MNHSLIPVQGVIQSSIIEEICRYPDFGFFFFDKCFLSKSDRLKEGSKLAAALPQNSVRVLSQRSTQEVIAARTLQLVGILTPKRLVIAETD